MLSNFSCFRAFVLLLSIIPVLLKLSIGFVNGLRRLLRFWVPTPFRSTLGCAHGWSTSFWKKALNGPIEAGLLLSFWALSQLGADTIKPSSLQDVISRRQRRRWGLLYRAKIHLLDASREGGGPNAPYSSWVLRLNAISCLTSALRGSWLNSTWRSCWANLASTKP